MILIADSHVSENNKNVENFFEMLNKIAQTKHSVIFLGDVFDLWISIPRYQTEEQLRFLKWCSDEKKKRTVGFVEGNRDFFVKQYNSDFFTWVEENSLSLKVNNKRFFFCHGDAININDKQYQYLRKITKCSFTRMMFKILPFGSFIANYLKNFIKDTNLRNKKYFPKDIIKGFADSLFEDEINIIVTGHFHSHYEYIKSENHKLIVLEDWWKDNTVAIINDDGNIESKVITFS